MYLSNMSNSVYSVQNNHSIKQKNKNNHKKYYQITPQESPVFKGGTKVLKQNPLKKVLPVIGAALLSLITCCNNTKVSEAKDIGGVKVECFEIRKDTQTAIENAIIDTKAKCTNTDFMDNVSVDVAKKFSSLPNDTPFRTYMKGISNSRALGSSFYSDGKLPKGIVIQEDAHASGLSFLSNENSTEMNNSLRFTLMHEFGHHFDKYYGHDHDADFAVAYEDLLVRMAEKDSQSVFKSPTERKDMEIFYTYNIQSGLSDKTEFKEAFKKDLEHIAQIKRTGNGTLSRNIKYFTNGIDFSREITDEIVDTKDALRSEVYANLFSYGLGENNGDREAFLSNFPNCYEVVKANMKHFIGIK